MIRGAHVVAAVAVSALAAAACQHNPPALLPCPVPSVDAYETPTGVFYVFDQENMDKLAARLQGLIDRTCLGLPAHKAIPDGGAAS